MAEVAGAGGAPVIEDAATWGVLAADDGDAAAGVLLDEFGEPADKAAVVNAGGEVNGPEGEGIGGGEVGGDELTPAVAIADEGDGFGVEAGGEVGVGELGEVPLAGKRVKFCLMKHAAEADVGLGGSFGLDVLG